MSEDRDRIYGSDEGEEPEDVDAHQHSTRGETDEDGDDVEAHQHSARGQHSGRGAADEGDDDDVEAHQHSGRG